MEENSMVDYDGTGVPENLDDRSQLRIDKYLAAEFYLVQSLEHLVARKEAAIVKLKEVTMITDAICTPFYREEEE